MMLLNGYQRAAFERLTDYKLNLNILEDTMHSIVLQGVYMKKKLKEWPKLHWFLKAHGAAFDIMVEEHMQQRIMKRLWLNDAGEMKNRRAQSATLCPSAASASARTSYPSASESSPVNACNVQT